MKTAIIAQIYGYIMLIASTIVFIVGGNVLISDVFTYYNPQSSYECSQYVSYESYSSYGVPYPETVVNEDVYAKRKAECIEAVKARALPSVAKAGFTVISAIAIFVTHLIFIRRNQQTK